MEDKIEIGLILSWALMFVIVMVLILFSLNYHNKVLKVEQEKQAVAFKASIEAEEKLKERIANNLHDEILPLLTVLKQNIQSGKRAMENGDGLKSELYGNVEIINRSIEGIRGIALDLISATFINFGLLKAIEEFTLRQGGAGVLVEFCNTVEGELAFSKPRQIHIYRMCTEILANLYKHAQYSCLSVITGKSEAAFTVQFVHDGKSVSNEDIALFTQSSAGLGLKSLRSRAFILDARIDYSKKDQVPVITLEVPLRYD